MPRILIVKTSSLGDVVHNLPLINDIRAHFAEAQIDWVVEESFAAIPQLHPHVDKVIAVAVRRWRHALSSKSTWREIGACRHALRSRSYDVILDTQGLLKSALIANLAHGIRHGQDRQSAREALAACFYQQVHTISRKQHAVARNRELAAKALGYAVPEAAPDYGLAANEASLSALPFRLPQAYVVGLHGTSRDSKLWPIEHWITLGRHLSEQGLGLLLPWNNAAEFKRANLISAQVAQALVLPRLNLNQLATVLMHAQAAVGVDTGLSHLAVALRIPTLAIYTDTDPNLTGVYAGANLAAVNLGGKMHTPDAGEVIQILPQLLPAQA